MTTHDDWGRDPSVRAMRRLFARMESGQGALLKRLGIPPYDTRLRACRDEARDLFEKAFSRPGAARARDEGDAAALYIQCLIRALRERGLRVPADAVREDAQIGELIGRP